MSNISFLVVGGGHIGKRHAAMIQAHPDATLEAIVEIDPTAVENVQQQFPEIRCYSTIEEAIQQHPSTSVVNICTPNGNHIQNALIALHNNCHVVIEKPMGLSTSDCEEALHLALQKEKQVFIVMQNRYSPPSKWLKEVVQEEVLGTLFHVSINCFWNRGEAYYQQSNWKGTLAQDGGPLYTQFSHFIDIMYWLFGDIINIHADFQNHNHQEFTEFEDSGVILFDFKKGGKGCLQYSTSVADQNFESSITIIGEKGTIKVGGQYMDKVEYCNIQDYTMPELEPTEAPNSYGFYTGSAANHHFLIQNVIDTLQKRSQITTNALEGLKVVDIIERIYQHRK